MRRSLLIASVAAAAATALGATALATGTLAAKTYLTIKGPQGDFSGTITSTRLHKCAENRTVNVYKQRGSLQKPKNDMKIGSDTSELRGKKGYWSIGNSGFKSGRFYARAPAKVGCRAGATKTIRVS